MLLPPLRVALCIADPSLAARIAARLGEIPGVAALAVAPGRAPGGAPGAAEVVLADAMPAAAMAAPMAAPMAPADGRPVLVLAAGGAALAALRAGAQAVLPPEASAEELAAALGALRAGLVTLPAAALAALLGRRDAPAPGAATPSALTPREQEVLGLLAAGASNKLIARRLGLSFHTVKAHVAAVLAKLGAGSRADAVARGARAGLVLL
jgi:DNA-binding NarL/FixJ family response regulator